MTSNLGHSSLNRQQYIWFFLLIIAAVVVRFYFIPEPGYMQDIHNFKVWSETAATHGIINIYDKILCDYNPGYLYILNSIGHLYANFYPGFDEHTYLFNFLIKTPAIIADVALSIIIFFLAMNKVTYKQSLLMMSLFAFNPAIIANSAYWGQVDSVPTLVALLSVVALNKANYKTSVVLITVAILIKTQMAMILPVILFVLWKRKGLSELARALVTAWLSFIVFLLPFVIAGKIEIVVDKLFGAVGAYPYISMNAFNFWWLFSGGRGREIYDSSLFLDIFTYQSIGLLVFGLFFILLLSYLNKNLHRQKIVYLCCGLAFFAFYMLPTEMHERYIMPALPFLLLASLDSKKLKLIYLALSASIFFSLHTVLLWTYPENYPNMAGFLRDFPMGLLISIINVLLFMCFVFYLARNLKKQRLFAFAGLMTLTVTILALSHEKQDVFLTDLNPVREYQQWGKRQTHKQVSGGRLSVNGHVFRNGIGAHAYSYIDYNISNQYQFLEGYIGINYSANVGNKIEFRIIGDERLIYSSGILQGRLDPIYLKVPVDGIRILRLEARDGGDGINNDHADWLNMKLLP